MSVNGGYDDEGLEGVGVQGITLYYMIYGDIYVFLCIFETASGLSTIGKSILIQLIIDLDSRR